MSAADTKLTLPSETTPQDVQFQTEFQLYGAITATQAVLPALREAGTGTLLFTTGAGSVDPVPQVGNVNAAAAALRNWAINLNKELTGTGVYAVHVGIDVSINQSVIPGFPTAPAEDIAAAYWGLHTTREHAEYIFTGLTEGEIRHRCAIPGRRRIPRGGVTSSSQVSGHRETTEYDRFCAETVINRSLAALFTLDLMCHRPASGNGVDLPHPASRVISCSSGITRYGNGVVNASVVVEWTTPSIATIRSIIS
jgi:hypothetical protein